MTGDQHEDPEINMPDREIFSQNTLPSLESLYGWQSQYARMMRWHDRLKIDDSLDMLLTFFLNCYALRDWLRRSEERRIYDVIEMEVKKDNALKLCRDLCNRSKHLVLTQPSVDACFMIATEWRDEPEKPAIVVMAGGEKSDLHQVADQCMAFWGRVLRENGLHPQPDDLP